MAKTNNELLEQARKDFEYAAEYEHLDRVAARDDMRFVYNIDNCQWPDDVTSERGDRPCLTVNLMKKFVRQVTGGIRLNRPSIKVRPVDSAGDPIIAKIYEEQIRDINNSSNASIAFETAMEHAIAGGFGYARVLTDFINPRSFEQEIVIKRIKNPFTVYFQRNIDEYDYRDARFCFITNLIERDKFEEEYPDALTISFKEATDKNMEIYWFQEEHIRIAEYFYKVPTEVTYVQTSFGEIFELTDDVTKEVLKKNGKTIIKEKTVEVDKIFWVKMSGAEILEGPIPWAGAYIPVIPFIGEQVNIDGREYKISLVRDAKDPQKMYNYWRTTATEYVAMSPRAPWLATPDQVKGFEAVWEQANKKNFSWLPYNPTKEGKPTRQDPPQIPVGVLNEANISKQEISDVFGMFEASLGQRSNERSGVAQQQRRATSDRGNLSFIDNLMRSINYMGVVLVDLIPRIYDTERTMRLRGEDGADLIVTINQKYIDGSGNEVILNDLSIGRYDVRVDVGPSFSTKRLEAIDSMIQFIQFFPQAAPVIGDLIAKNMDWPGAEEIARRLEKFIPPEVREPGATITPGGLNAPAQQGVANV